MNKKTVLQVISLVALVLFFVVLDIVIFNIITYRYVNHADALTASKSIKLDDFLPFDKSSGIVNIKGETLSGDLPVLDGATALFPIYSAFMNSTYPEGSCIWNGADFSPDSYLQKTGTTKAYQRILDGNADIIFVAGPSEKQLQAEKDAGVELVYVPIGYEAFVFIVNSGNPVDNLTTSQIKDIYTGKIRNWSDVGGIYTPINALTRAEGSGSQTAMLAFMGDEKIEKNITDVFGKSIGYSFRYYVSDLSGKENIKTLALDGVAPTVENIRNGTYPEVDAFYAVYRKDDDNPNIKLLIDFILSQKGQDIVSGSGYVGVELK